MIDNFQAYWKKFTDIEVDIEYCRTHDTEYLSGEKCYVCEQDRKAFVAEMEERKSKRGDEEK